MITVSVTFAKVVVLDGRVKHDALHGEVDLAQMYADGMYQACPHSVTLLLSKYGDLGFGCKIINFFSLY